MKTIATTVALLAVLLLAGTAHAGLHFASSYQTNAPSSPTAVITINAAGGTYNPVGTVDFSGTGALQNAVLDVLWSPYTANANTNSGSGDLILWFGSISIPGGNSLFLSSVGVSEDGSSFVFETFNTSLGAGGPMAYHVHLNDFTIPPANRDQIVAARISFTYTSGVTFTLDGVSTPEPTTLALFGLGLLGLGGAAVRRRRRRAKAP
jgi:hypothetical protein